jgi:hypothetical protein
MYLVVVDLEAVAVEEVAVEVAVVVANNSAKVG